MKGRGEFSLPRNVVEQYIASLQRRITIIDKNGIDQLNLRTYALTRFALCGGSPNDPKKGMLRYPLLSVVGHACSQQAFKRKV